MPDVRKGLELEAWGVGFRVGSSWLLRRATLQAAPGTLTAVVGPNGAGKSTLVRLLAGELRPTEGSVLLDGVRLEGISPSRLARDRAVLSQSRNLGFPLQARDVVRLGRLPHKSPREIHDAAVEQALVRVEAEELADRNYQTLSGGECMRVDLARILAQDPRVLLLDEPTNHLDPRHQLQVLALARELADEGRTVVAVLHDLNLAALHADNLVLLDRGNLVAQGPPHAVLTAGRLLTVFGLSCQIWRHPSGCPWVVPFTARWDSPSQPVLEAISRI